MTFDPTFDEGSVLLPGTYHTHPDFGFSGPGGRSDPHDIAVIVLDAPVTGIAPARLPTLNFLDTLALKRERFTAVGYGAVRETIRGARRTSSPTRSAASPRRAPCRSPRRG